MQGIDGALQVRSTSSDVQRLPLADIEIGAGVVAQAEGIFSCSGTG